MASKLNRYFNNRGRSLVGVNERNLMQRLTNECIQIHGFEVTYIFREDDPEKLKEVWREDTSPKYEKSFRIEAFLESYDNPLPGAGLTNTPYALQIDQMAKIQISLSRWKEERLEKPELQIPETPKAGDLVLLTFGDIPGDEDLKPCDLFEAIENKSISSLTSKLFEVMLVYVEPPSQSKVQLVYHITLRLFDYANEDINLRNTDSNNFVQNNYTFDEFEKLQNLKTSGLDAITGWTDPETGKEHGNIKEVVGNAQNRDLEAKANKVSRKRRNPPVGESPETSPDPKDTGPCGSTISTEPVVYPCDPLPDPNYSSKKRSKFDLPPGW